MSCRLPCRKRFALHHKVDVEVSLSQPYTSSPWLSVPDVEHWASALCTSAPSMWSPYIDVDVSRSLAWTGVPPLSGVESFFGGKAPYWHGGAVGVAEHGGVVGVEESDATGLVGWLPIVRM